MRSVAETTGCAIGGRRLCAYVAFTLRRRIFTPPLTVVRNLTSAVGYARRSAASAQRRRESRIRTGDRSGLDLKEIGLNGSGTTPALRMLTGSEGWAPPLLHQAITDSQFGQQNAWPGRIDLNCFAQFADDDAQVVVCHRGAGHPKPAS